MKVNNSVGKKYVSYSNARQYFYLGAGGGATVTTVLTAASPQVEAPKTTGGVDGK